MQNVTQFFCFFKSFTHCTKIRSLLGANTTKEVATWQMLQPL